METWRSVLGYEGLYEVSSHGRVRSLDRHVANRHGTVSLRKGILKKQVRIGRQSAPGGRYAAVNLCKDGVEKLIKVHVLVAEAFIGPRPAGKITRHLDGDNFNNHYKNLAWGTHQENSDDMKRHGTVLFGADHGSAKLTEAKVRRIKRMLRTHTNQAVAEKMGMSNQQISNIKLGKCWAHVEV